jgi:hypothetical protein
MFLAILVPIIRISLDPSVDFQLPAFAVAWISQVPALIQPYLLLLAATKIGTTALVWSSWVGAKPLMTNFTTFLLWRLLLLHTAFLLYREYCYIEKNFTKHLRGTPPTPLHPNIN